MKLAVTRTRRGDYTKLAVGLSHLPRPFWNRVGQVAAGSILDNITRQKQASGAALKRNKPATLERKLKEGKPPLALVDALHRFVRGGGASWKILEYLPDGRGIVVGPATDELTRLVKYLAQKGYRGYIGINAKARAALAVLLRNEIRAMFRRAAGAGNAGSASSIAERFITGKWGPEGES